MTTRDRPAWVRVLGAGLGYFLIVFLAGFLLGTVRVLLLVPRFGEPVAVMLELPLMLAISWLASRWLIARYDVPARCSARLIMGAAGFALLMLGELGVSTLAFGRTLAEHLAHYRDPSAQLGLAGQVAFAMIPVLQLVKGPRRAP